MVGLPPGFDPGGHHRGRRSQRHVDARQRKRDHGPGGRR